MAKTVVGLFDTVEEANSVVTDLANRGFKRNDISLVANNASGANGKDYTTTTANETNQSGDGEPSGEAAGSGAVTGTMVGGGLGLLVGLGALLIPGIGPVIAAGPIATVLGMTAAGAGIGAAAGGLIGALTHAGVPEQDAQYYAEGVKRGGTLVMVASPDDQAQEAYDIMQNHGAVDIEERGENFRKEGWNGFDHNSQPYNAQQVDTYRKQASPKVQTENTGRQMNQGEQVIPVVQEELSVGKREVQRGGARIFTHVTEQPVEEQVTLREEKINIDRQPVNRAVSQADMAAMKEGVIELTETDEEAVVAKQARVVEEVRVGKEVTERTETVRDQVRRTDVEVQQEAGQTGSSFTSYDTDFRNHFKGMNVSGANYDQYQPVYQYGYNLGTDQNYTGQEWNAIETNARKQWEVKNPNTWDRFKDSIRYGWEKSRNQAGSAMNNTNNSNLNNKSY